MITTKKTAVKTAKDKAAHNRELVLVMLEWTELEHGNFVMEKAAEYLQRQCGADTYGIEFLLQQKMFWAWWRNKWAARDEHFLAVWADCDCLIDVRNEYEFTHSAANLHIRPHRVIMEKSYMDMVQQVIKNEQNGQHI